MKLALISKIICPTSIQILEYFVRNGHSIEFVIVENSIRTKFSKSEIKFRNAHDKFNKKFKKHSIFRRNLKWIWNKCLSSKTQNLITLNSFWIPLVKESNVQYRAGKLGVPVHLVEKHSAKKCLELLKDHSIDIVLFGSSNWLLKKELLAIDNCRIINVHPGKLPDFKGLDSMPWSIMKDTEIGSTAFFIDETIDGGDILDFYPMEIMKSDSIVSIQKRMASQKPRILFEVVNGLAKKTISPQKQSHAGFLCSPMSYDELIIVENQLQEMIKARH